MPTWSPVAAAPGGLTPTTSFFTANLAQAAAAYTLATSTGGVLITRVSIFVTTAGATFTSVAIATNNTTADAFLTAGEGAVANVTVGKNLKDFSVRAWLPTTKLVQYTIVGATGTGALQVAVEWIPGVAGATLA